MVCLGKEGEKRMFHVKHGKGKHRTPSSGFSRDESLESVQVKPGRARRIETLL